MKNYPRLLSKILEIYKMNNIANSLYWDLCTYTPEASKSAKRECLNIIKRQANELLACQEIGKLKELIDKSREKLSLVEKRNVDLIYQQHIRAKQSRSKAYTSYNDAISRCEDIWQKNRNDRAYNEILPTFEEIIQSAGGVQEFLTEKEKKLKYQRFVNYHSPEAKLSDLKDIYKKIADRVPRIIEEANKKQKTSNNRTEDLYLTSSQMLNLYKCVAKKMGFNFQRGRIDKSYHFFCGGYPGDERILLRTSGDFISNIMKAVHEIGHGLYEQGLPEEYMNQPVGKAAGMALHESQAIFMEMHIGRTYEFMELLAKILHDEFNIQGERSSVENLYRRATQISHSATRLESDELSSLLHVLVRCEIEEDLIEGNTTPRQLPAVWNNLMKKYLKNIPHQTNSFMQDIHWFKGYFGYFPTYILGAIYAYQLSQDLKCHSASFLNEVAKGNFSEINEYLKNRVWKYGSTSPTKVWLNIDLGSTQIVDDYIDYLENKYLGERGRG